MNGNRWNQTVTHFLLSPTVGVLALIALVGLSLCTMVDAEALARPQHVMLFAPH